MAGTTSNNDGDIGFQIAPMIDLILVLMVFFMTTVALKQVENELGIGLPGTSMGDTDAHATVDMHIEIDVDGAVTMNGDSVGEPRDKQLDKLRDKLKEQIELFDDRIPVVIIPQPNVPHRRVIDVLNACSAAKVKNISFNGT